MWSFGWRGIRVYPGRNAWQHEENVVAGTGS